MQFQILIVEISELVKVILFYYQGKYIYDTEEL